MNNACPLPCRASFWSVILKDFLFVLGHAFGILVPTQGMKLPLQWKHSLNYGTGTGREVPLKSSLNLSRGQGGGEGGKPLVTTGLRRQGG